VFLSNCLPNCVKIENLCRKLFGACIILFTIHQGVSKVKEVKAAVPSSDPIYVVILAGLTDVLIKSIDDGKSMLSLLFI